MRDEWDRFEIMKVIPIALMVLLTFAAFAEKPAISVHHAAKYDELSGILSIDSSNDEKEFEWASYAMTATDGLKPGARYSISFKAKVEGFGKDAYLYVLVRPKSVPGAEKDVARLAIPPTDGAVRSYRMTATIGDLTDYRLQFHSHNRIKAEVADIEISELPALGLVLIPPRAPRAERPANLPVGAKEFEVDLPRHASELVLKAVDFGVSTTNRDNTSQLRTAFAEAKRRHASKLELAPGDYRVLGDAPFSLDNFTDFTFDGKGARFVCLRKNGPFMHIKHCVRTRLVNFSLDWDWDNDPLASIVEIGETGQGYADLVFKDYDDFPNKDSAFLLLSPFDTSTRSVGVEGMSTKYLNKTFGPISKFDGEWISPNVARVRMDARSLKKGEIYRLQHYYYHMNGFTMESNEHLRLENVKVLSTPGHAFAIFGTQHHTLFDHVDIVAPKQDPRRVITCTADHLHVACSRGYIKLENCEFSLGADDIFNMHDNSGFARRHGERTVRTQNAFAYGKLAKGTKIELRHGDYSPTGFIGTVANEKPVNASAGIYDITFDEKVPVQTTDGFVMFDRTYDTHNVIVRNCNFHDNRARGLLILARDVTVENNVFRHQEQGAIKIETGYTFNAWSEGYGVSNVVIRGNIFDNSNPSGSNGLHRERTIYSGIYLRNDPSADVTDYPIISGLLFEDNVFRDSYGVSAYITSATNVTFLNNRFEDPTPHKKNLDYRAQLYFSNVSGLQVLGNYYEPSPNVKAPGIVYDPQTVKFVQ